MVVEVVLAHKIQIQIWATFGLWTKWSYMSVNTFTISILKLEVTSTGGMKWKNGLMGSNVQMLENTQPTLPIALWPFTITYSEMQALLRVPSGPVSAVSDFQLLVQIWVERRSGP